MRAIQSILAGIIVWLLAAPAFAGEVGLTARLVDPVTNASKATAIVQVQVVGVELIDPALAAKDSKAIQGHLHYRVDDGPVVATPIAKLAFHDLGVGPHRILVELADSDHQPLGPSQILEVVIPPVTARQ